MGWRERNRGGERGGGSGREGVGRERQRVRVSKLTPGTFFPFPPKSDFLLEFMSYSLHLPSTRQPQELFLPPFIKSYLVLLILWFSFTLFKTVIYVRHCARF